MVSHVQRFALNSATQFRFGTRAFDTNFLAARPRGDTASRNAAGIVVGHLARTSRDVGRADCRCECAWRQTQRSA